MDEQKTDGARPDAAKRPQESGVAAPGRGGRMSRQRKTAAVLRLLRGEDLETVSRGLGVTAARLAASPFHGEGHRKESRPAARFKPFSNSL